MKRLLRRVLRFTVHCLVRLELRLWGLDYNAHSEVVSHAQARKVGGGTPHPYIYQSPSQGLPDVRVRPYDEKNEGTPNWE